MRHISSALIKTIIIFASISLITACDGKDFEEIVLFKNVGDPDLFEDDVEINVDRKTMDIEVDTSEELSLKLLQATLFMYMDNPLYRYLDASEFPKVGELLCKNEVSDSRPVFARFNSSRAAGEAYQEGDTVSVEYSNCQLESGKEVSGTLSIKYSEIIGLNDKFAPISTEYCVEQLQDQKEDSTEPYATLYVVGDEVQFKADGDEVNVDVYSYSYDQETNERIEELKTAQSIRKDQPTLIINERLDLEGDSVTSIDDGDQVYFAYEGTQEEQHCQQYVRRMEVETDTFSVREGDVISTISGLFTLTNVSRDLNLESFNIVDSELTVVIRENASVNEFMMEEFNAQKIEDPEQDSYSIGFSGFVTSPELDGDIEIDASSGLTGINGEYPIQGAYLILGRGFERITLTAELDHVLRVGVDYDGEDLLGYSVADESFNTTWDKLRNRVYMRESFIPDEDS